MKDNFGRNIDYLRVSVTQRCNLNCVYCGKQDCEKKDNELLPYLQDDDALLARVEQIILKKPAGHAFGSETTTHGLNKTGG